MLSSISKGFEGQLVQTGVDRWILRTTGVPGDIRIPGSPVEWKDGRIRASFALAGASVPQLRRIEVVRDILKVNRQTTSS